MADRDEIVLFCDALLEPTSFVDVAPNGMQVPGAPKVDRIATGVSASAELFQEAAEWGAQLVLAHHGIFWDGQSQIVTAQRKRRLELLFDADMSLVAYHIPLDAHRETGNNALLARLLGFEVQDEPFGHFKGGAIGVVGSHSEGVPAASLIDRLTASFGQAPLAFCEGPQAVRRIGVVTGGGSSCFGEAIGAGLDAFITGEPTEHVMADARESGVHFLAAGHYWTETLGVRRLGDAVAAQFGVEHRFFEIPNPI